MGNWGGITFQGNRANSVKISGEKGYATKYLNFPRPFILDHKFSYIPIHAHTSSQYIFIHPLNINMSAMNPYFQIN
jgi:hypothetical protein